MRTWKQAWRRLPAGRRSGWVVDLIALGATMTTVSATSTLPAFWRGASTGVSGIGTLCLIVWLLRLQGEMRRQPPPPGRRP